MSLPPANKSWMDVMALQTPKERMKILASMTSQMNKEVAWKSGETKERLLLETFERLKTDWNWIARREQFAPEGDWAIWLIRTGRGWGKTRVGAEWIIEQHKQGVGLSGIIARTREDLFRYNIRGPSGILSVAPKDFMPYTQGDSLRWPGAGQAPYPNSESLLFFSKNPDSIRGPNLEVAWCDELAGWLAPMECWNNLRFTMRTGEHPRIVITTTPKPIRVIRDLVEAAAKRPERVRMTVGSTYDNASNLSGMFIEEMGEYEGTRIGRQELHGDVLLQAEGALWDWDWFERPGFRLDEPRCDMEKIAVAVDPAATSTEDASETGMVKGGRGEDGRGYLLSDFSGKYTPEGWAKKAIFSYFGFDDGIAANIIVAERNNGGEMVKATIDATARELKRKGEIPTAHIPVKVVWASHGKAARAEPVSTRYEMGRVSHCGDFPELEYQLTSWEQNSGMKSPDRLDALVWLFTYCLETGKKKEWDIEDVITVAPLAASMHVDPYDENNAIASEFVFH